MTPLKIAEDLEALAKRLQQDIANLETFAFGKLTLNQLRHEVEKAYCTAHHTARCLETYAKEIREKV